MSASQASLLHCKDKISKFWNKYSQKRNIGVSVPISPFMRLWVIYICPWPVCLFCWRKYVDRSWDYINRSKTHECGNRAEAALFPEKEYISGIFVAVYTLKVAVMESIYASCIALSKLQWYGSMRIIIKKSIVMHMPPIRFQFWTFCCAFKLISSGYTNSSNLSYMLLFCLK